MEKLTPQQAEARAKTMLTYLKGVTEQGYDITVLAKGASAENPNNAHLVFSLSSSEIKSAPDNIKAKLSVPKEIVKISRRYESIIVLPKDGTSVLWYLKPDTGKHSHIVTYGRQLHAGGTEMDWIRQKIEARKKIPRTA